MPLPPAPARTAKPSKRESVGDLLRRTNLEEFQRKAIFFGLATVIGAMVWFANRDIPFNIAAPLIGYLAIETGKNIKRWREWQQSRRPADLVHPDRVAEMQQQAVKAMSDAVKARAWLTRGIIACIAVPSALELFVGLEHAVDVASVEPRAVLGGDWWRLLGGTYLHGSPYHFAGNMGALFLYGSILEAKTSRLRLPLVYLLSALGGSVASVLMPPDVPSIGASGGVVGVIAYLFLFSRRQELKFPAAFRHATASVFIGLITAGALGFWYIDNPGHAGGAIAGFLLAGLIVDPARNYGDEISLPLFDLLGSFAMALIVAGAIITSMALLGV